jgi:hypothetical protein
LKNFSGENAYSLKGMKNAPLQKVGNPFREVFAGKLVGGNFFGKVWEGSRR